MAWKKTDLLERGRLNEKQVLRCLLDFEKRITALEEDAGEDEETGSQDISFTINDGTSPVGGASVIIGSTTKTTGSAGGCTFSGVSEGSVSVTVSATGYNTKTESISVDSTHTSFTISLTPIIYSFTSYDSATKDTEYGTGTAQATGVTSGDYAQIKVLTNSVDGFEGNTYYILADAETDGTTAYQLFEDAGTTGTGIYVTISE